jgi:signal transduction histidine kinase
LALAGLVAGLIGRQARLSRLKSDWTATVSHELRPPLAGMRALVETLIDGRYRSEEQAQEYVRLIARENERLTRLVENFLPSRAWSGRRWSSPARPSIRGRWWSRPPRW